MRNKFIIPLFFITYFIGILFSYSIMNSLNNTNYTMLGVFGFLSWIYSGIYFYLFVLNKRRWENEKK